MKFLCGDETFNQELLVIQNKLSLIKVYQIQRKENLQDECFK